MVSVFTYHAGTENKPGISSVATVCEIRILGQSRLIIARWTLHCLSNRSKSSGPTWSSRLRSRWGESRPSQEVGWKLAGQVVESTSSQGGKPGIIALKLVKERRKLRERGIAQNLFRQTTLVAKSEAEPSRSRPDWHRYQVRPGGTRWSSALRGRSATHGPLWLPGHPPAAPAGGHRSDGRSSMSLSRKRAITSSPSVAPCTSSWQVSHRTTSSQRDSAETTS